MSNIWERTDAFLAKAHERRRKATELGLEIKHLPYGRFLLTDLPPGPISGMAFKREFESVEDLDEFLDGKGRPKRMKAKPMKAAPRKIKKKGIAARVIKAMGGD